jgi:N-formylglutamate deformylase
VHALQVEINRGLYLDEDRIERSAGYEEVRHRLTSAIAHLLAVEPSILGRNRRHQNFAAE